MKMEKYITCILTNMEANSWIPTIVEYKTINFPVTGTTTKERIKDALNIIGRKDACLLHLTRDLTTDYIAFANLRKGPFLVSAGPYITGFFLFGVMK